MTSRKQLVAYPEPCLAASNEAEEHFFENVDAVQTIITQENGFLSQDQRNMLVLSSAMLIGAPVHHGHQPILVSLSTLYVDAKQIKNGMDNNDNASTTEESQATGLRLDSKIAESCFSEVNKGIQNAAAQQAFSPVVPVVSRSVYLRCVRKGFFKYITIYY